MNPLPPQAFTTETLSKAFAWLQSQPESIRSMASNPELLVSLYLKAKLNGDQALDRPSIQNFKNELKSLAGMMGEFENENPTRPPMAGNPKFFGGTPSPGPNFPPTYPQQNAPISTPSAAAQNSGLELDARSRAALNEVRAEFNLSSETEALRFLIQVGMKSLNKLK